MNPVLVFLESSDVGAAYSAEAAHRLGYEALFLVTPRNYQGDTRAQLEAFRCLECDTYDVAAMAARLESAGVHDVVGVMTFLDSRLVPAFELASRLGVPGPDAAVARLKDKAHVTRLISEHSPLSIEFSRRQVPLDRLARLLGVCDRIVVKPTKTAGALGMKVFTLANLENIPAHVVNAALPGGLDDGQWVAQVFLDGPLYSLEGYVSAGRVCFLGVSDRRKVGSTESRLRFPSESELGDQGRRDAESAVAKLVERSGFRDGFFHVEFIYSEGRPWIIDANVGRLGGGPLGEMIPLSFGIEVEDFFAFVIDVSLFGGRRFDATRLFSRPRVKTQGLCYGSEVAGVLSAVRWPGVLRSRHTRIVDLGTRVPAMGGDNWGWIGLLSGIAGDTEAEASAGALRIDDEDRPLCY